MDEPEGFRDFVDAHSRQLLRSAWLLTGDWSSAEDLVQTALAVLWPRWSGIAPADPARYRYVQRVMVTTYLRWRRRRWVGEVPTERLADLTSDSTHDQMDDAMLRRDLMAALKELPSRQRAAIVLRYFADATEAETATIIGCSVGSVKSHTSRGLARLREVPGLSELLTGGGVQ